MKAVIAIALALALSGCGTLQKMEQKRNSWQAEINATVPVCTSDEECKTAWATARNWVISNCGMKIQNIADGYIETYGSIDTRLACRVVGEPRGDGAWALMITTSCGNMFGCSPDKWQAAIQFNHAVGRVITKPLPDWLKK